MNNNYYSYSYHSAKFDSHVQSHVCLKYSQLFQVKAVWDDLSTPFRTFPGTDVIWKHLKTLQLDMPDLRESFLVSLLGDNIPRKRGWLNDWVSIIDKHSILYSHNL